MAFQNLASICLSLLNYLHEKYFAVFNVKESFYLGSANAAGREFAVFLCDVARTYWSQICWPGRILFKTVSFVCLLTFYDVCREQNKCEEARARLHEFKILQ